MRERRIDQYISKFQTRKESLEKQLKQANKPKYQFFPERKLRNCDLFLMHLKNYEETTSDLIESNLENAKFYNAHYNAVVKLLENIENKIENSITLVDQDFILIVPNSVQYKKTRWDTFKDVLTYSLWGALYVGLAGFILGGIGGIIAILCIGGVAAIPDSLLFGFIIAIAGFIVGAIIGVIVGLFVGLWIVPSLDKPLDNPYLEGNAFKCHLLEEAYNELRDVSTELPKNDGANDEVAGLDTSF